IDVHVVELSPALATAIARGMALALIAVCAFAALRARSRRAEWLSMQAFVPLALLVSPITWKAHHAALVPVFFALCCASLERVRARGWVLFLCVYWIACDLMSEDVVGKTAKRALQAMSVVTWFDVALIVALVVLTLRESRPTPTED